MHRWSQGSHSTSDRARLPPPTRKAKRARRRNFNAEKSAEGPELESITAVIVYSRTTKNRQGIPGLQVDTYKALDAYHDKFKNTHRFDGWVQALARMLTLKAIVLYDRSACEVVIFHAYSRALVPCHQLQQEQQLKNQTLFKFMLSLRTLLILSITKDLCRTEWATITRNKDHENMFVHHLAIELENIQTKVIDKQGSKSITHVVEIRKFLHFITDVIKESIRHDLIDDVTKNEILTTSEKYEDVNRGGHAEHIRPGYYSSVSSYSHTTSTPSSHHAQHLRPDKG